MIARYRTDAIDEWCEHMPIEAPDGEWVLWEDHNAEVTRLTEALSTVTAEQEQLLADSAIRSDQRVAYERLCARLSVHKASEQEAIDAIKALCRDNERLALLAGKNRARAEAAEAALDAARAEEVERGRADALREIKEAVDAHSNEVWREFCRDTLSALISAPAGPSLAGVLADLARRQEPLDAALEQAVEADRDKLYED